MSAYTKKLLHKKGETRGLDGRALLLHYKHVQAGTKYTSKCQYCQYGPSAVVKAVTAPVPEPVVRESDGDDKKEAATLSPDGGWVWQS